MDEYWSKWVKKPYEADERKGDKVRGIKYGRKLSLLEGYATLQAAFTWDMQGQEQGGMCLNCDNLGFTWAFYTLAKALNDLAYGLGIVIQVYYQNGSRWRQYGHRGSSGRGRLAGC